MGKCLNAYDGVISATSDDGTVSVAAAVSTELVREAQRRHTLAPTASAALGRLLTAAALLGASSTRHERIALQIAADGPLLRLYAEASLLDERTIGVRGNVARPHVDLPLNALGKFDVGTAVGTGSLCVTRTYDTGPPYVGVVALTSGEIGDDIAAYLARSEQVPSIVALGVLADQNGIRVSGGIIAQALPGSEDLLLEQLEARAHRLHSVTEHLSAGGSARSLAEVLLGGQARRALTEYNVRFACRCSRPQVQRTLLALGPDELLHLAEEQAITEAVCEICKECYLLTREEILEIADQAAKTQKN
ncbi:MAG TPA: Hsp33 family molecular chaperone HslO [Candidatus Baltobacteraceae bacterium]|nr:Hsp33 family molecular chaperone HslO [Candidatus Baltobacteraceae bacterium]